MSQELVGWVVHASEEELFRLATSYGMVDIWS